MDPTLMQTDLHSSNSEQRTPTMLSPSPVITPPKPKSRDLLADVAGWSSYPDIPSQAPGSENGGGLHPSGNLTSEIPSGMTHALGGFRKASHLPTPQSPGSMESYLLTRTPTSQNDTQSTVLPTEFRSHVSPSPLLFQPRSIPTPEPSPLTVRTRHGGRHSLSQLGRTDDNDRATLGGVRPRAPTPPRTPTRQIQTRPVTPVSRSRPISPIQWRQPEHLLPNSPQLNSCLNNSPTNLLSQSVKDEPEAEVTRIRAESFENHPTTAETAESRRPDYLKRTRRLAPSSTGTGEVSLPSELGGKDGSLLWSSVNVGVVDSPVRGKRIALFQETSEESFEESLMAGGYGRYRSDRSSWKRDEDAEVPNQLGDAKGEEGGGSGLVLTEDEKRKKTRLAAFLDPPRVPPSAAQLFPVEIEGCGRVLMKVEPSEPQTPPKPRPKAKRSRKRKRASADVKRDLDKDGVAAAEEPEFDGPNWPDAEFPWRSRLMTRGGLSSTEQEERLRFIESFLDRDSDEDEMEEGLSSSSRHSPDEASSRSPRPDGGKKYSLPSHSKGRRRTATMLSNVVPIDPADARSALLSKKSIRAVQLRLLRRQDLTGDSDDDEVLCICQGRDDGRPLVQCDACRTWYHLECIGIQSTSELGKEEDPWFCANCAEVKTPPPVVAPEPTFAPTDEVGRNLGGADLDRYDPPFLNVGLNPSPATPWTKSVKPPTTPPRSQRATYATPGSSWDEAPSSSSRGPRTPQFNAASAFGDMVQVYGMTPGRSLEPSLSATNETAFDPTSTPSRGIMFGLPFTTPMGSWQGVRGGNELFHTPKRPGEDGGTAWRYGQPFVYHGRVGDVSVEEPSGTQSLFRSSGLNNVTPIEREGIGGPKRMQVMESPLGAKRSRRMVGS